MEVIRRWHAASCRHADAVGFSLLALCVGVIGLLYLVGPLSGVTLWLPVGLLGLVGGYAGYLFKVRPVLEDRPGK